jgi:hypothetical protein
MALKEELVKEEQGNPEGQASDYLSEEELDDLKIIVEMAKSMINEGGAEVIEKAVEQSKDPGQVIGQFIYQLIEEIGSNAPADMDLSPNVLLVPGGAVEQISDFLQEVYEVNKETMDRAEMYVGDMAQQAAAASQQQPHPPANVQEAAMAMGGM